MRLPLMAALAATIALGGCGSAGDRASKAVARFDAAYAQRNLWVARLEINAALRLEDDVPEYWNRLGRVELALQHYLNAYTAYKNALLLDPQNIEAAQAVAELSYSGGSPDDAITYADKMLKLQPRNLRMLIVKGSVALDRKQYDEARRIAESMLSIDQSNESAAVLMARTKYASGDDAGATAYLEQSLKTNGETLPRLVALLDMYRARDDFAATDTTYRRIFRLAPNDVTVALEYARNMYEYNRGDLAFDALSRTLRQDPDDPRVEQRVIDLWASIGGNPVSIGQLAGLATLAGPEMRIALGRLAVDQKRYADALQFVDPIVGNGPVVPENVEARVVRAAALAGLGKTGQAKAIIDTALAFDRGNPHAIRTRIQIAIAEKRIDAALKDAQGLVARNQQDTGGRIALAQVYALRGEKQLADATYAGGIVDISNAVDILAAYVGWLVANGQRDRALDATRMFTRQNANTLAGWKLRGDLCVPARDARCIEAVIEGMTKLRGTEKLRAALQAERDKLPKPPPLEVRLFSDDSLNVPAPPVTTP